MQRFQPCTSWDSAAAQAVGYEEVPITVNANYSDPTISLGGNDLALLAAWGVALARLSESGGAIRVVDFGGADGGHAELMKSAFPEFEFDWTVVELPHVVNAMQMNPRPGIKFLDNIEAAFGEKVDVTLASASINYVAEPQALLKHFLSNSLFTIVTRLPLWPIPDHCAALQRPRNGSRKISYPAWFFSDFQFTHEILSYAKILLNFECPNDRAAFAGRYLTYRGLVLEPR